MPVLLSQASSKPPPPHTHLNPGLAICNRGSELIYGGLTSVCIALQLVSVNGLPPGFLLTLPDLGSRVLQIVWSKV